MISRRSLLTGFSASLIAALAIVRAASLDLVRGVPMAIPVDIKVNIITAPPYPLSSHFIFNDSDEVMWIDQIALPAGHTLYLPADELIPATLLRDAFSPKLR